MRCSVLILGLLCLTVLICSVNSRRRFKNKQDVQRSFNIIKRAKQRSKQGARNRLGRLDKNIQRRNRGERKLRRQVIGNRDNDFVNFDTAQLYGDLIANITGTAGIMEADFEIDDRGKVAMKFHPAVSQISRRLGVVGSDAPTTAAFEDVQQVTAQSCIFDTANNALCDTNTKFQTPSGHCNNLKDKTWGMAGTAFSRKLPSTYQDGSQEPRSRTHQTNELLPNPRTVSTVVTRTQMVLDILGFSNYIMQWGQYSAHEVTSIAETEPGATCCPDQLAQEQFGANPTQAQINTAREELQELRGDTCIAIELSNDAVHGDVCMSQVRSATVPNADCSPSPRLQMNTASHMVDGSAIYGSSTSAMNALRAPTGGKLKTQLINGVELPPKEDDSCSSKCPFAAGDGRINTTPNLISTHTLFIRKHNQIATELADINPDWDHERLFQESRRIIIAIEQNIHYNEWLQHLLGNTILNKHNMKRFTGAGFKNTYDSDLNPSLLNELATAAHRFGHTTVGEQFQCKNVESLVPNFNKPDIIYDDGIDECLAGLGTDRPWKFDRFFTNGMRDELFGAHLDIVALNINRGRDHGLDSYAEYRKAYGFSTITGWNDLAATHSQQVITALRRVYSDPRDVELYIGGVTEEKLPDGFIGPLFAEIMGDGYKKLRNGDRFYFESETAGFTVAQVNALRAYKYSNLICDVGGVTSIPTDAFKHSGPRNTALLCNRSPKLDLSLWIEGDSGPTCRWESQSESACCRGEKTVTRRCSGGTECRQGERGCEGQATVTVACSSNDGSCSSSCRWEIQSESKCCNGEKTVIRRCTGGPRCRQGRDGCEGKARITERCSENHQSCPADCRWNTVSSTGCCDGVNTIKRECMGGSSCRTGSSGCSGAASITESCSCPSWNPRCGNSCPSQDQCSWHTVSSSPCCNRYRTVKRECTGGSYCQAGSDGCTGSTTVTEQCQPVCSNNPYCASDASCSINPSCRWQITRTSQCCRGIQTVRRRCVEGRSCRAGNPGCPGRRNITQSCSPNTCRSNRNNRRNNRRDNRRDRRPS